MTDEQQAHETRYRPSAATLAARWFAWSSVGTLFVFFLNAYLSFWRGWPGAAAAFDSGTLLAWLQAGLYAVAVIVPAAFVMTSRARSLRADTLALSAIVNYIVKAAFWMVVLVGIADTVVSFLRVEGLLEAVVGDALAQDLGRNQYRGPHLHGPLIVAALVIAAVTRGLGFAWLALLVVSAELLIVISRFVFSYEQAFMADLVRLWYAGLFLFASAYTLVEEGHVRVDVLYTLFPDRAKGLVNMLGSLLLGLPFCWVILILGMSQPSSIITSPLLALEITQSGFGLYVKYLMAAFLAIFAGTMAIQFAAYVLEGLAEWRGDPGKRTMSAPALH